MSARAYAEANPAVATFAPATRGWLQLKCACGGSAGLTGQCKECDEEQLTLQRYATNQSGHSPMRPVPAIVQDALRSPGPSLDGDTRAFMESRFGHDFSQVRIHTDARADASAKAVNALAYTVGRDIVFAAGQYAPGTMSGKKLLAHELTHVLQQSTGASPPQIQFGGKDSDQYESEADAIAAQVVSMNPHARGLAAAPRITSDTPARLMRAPDKCLDKCEEQFNSCLTRTKFPPECIGARSVCQRNCAPPQEEPAPPSKKEKDKEEPAPVEKDKTPKTCETPKGPGKHPKKVSDKLVARWMSKHAEEGDPGEWCVETPYVAGAHEHVCTIGYGIQIPDCPVVRKTTGQPLSKEERKTAEVADLRCACEGRHIDCKGGEAETQLRKKAGGAVTHIHEVVPVDLNEAEFDALVDITMHVGHMPSELLDPIKKYWCTDEGKDYVREIYLKTALTPARFKKAFEARRKFRVWPPSLR
jgi:GH24 family phage-related lysozyme (muramidase)